MGKLSFVQSFFQNSLICKSPFVLMALIQFRRLTAKYVVKQRKNASHFLLIIKIDSLITRQEQTSCFDYILSLPRCFDFVRHCSASRSFCFRFLRHVRQPVQVGWFDLPLQSLNQKEMSQNQQNGKSFGNGFFFRGKTYPTLWKAWMICSKCILTGLRSAKLSI